jgi:hypothetical protein
MHDSASLTRLPPGCSVLLVFGNPRRSISSQGRDSLRSADVSFWFRASPALRAISERCAAVSFLELAAPPSPGRSKHEENLRRPEKRHRCGFRMDWFGHSGRRQMLITESLPSKKISVQADWVKPFVARNVNDFVLESTGTSTEVTWTMQGPNLYVMRIMGTFVNMDQTIGSTSKLVLPI